MPSPHDTEHKRVSLEIHIFSFFLFLFFSCSLFFFSFFLKEYHLCLSIATNSLWEALNVKACSPDKFMDVSDMQVSDEDGYMTRNLTITANSKIVNVRIWINPVISKIVFQPLHSDTDMSKNPINGVETIVRDDFSTLDAHSFEGVYQKTSLSTDDFYNHPEKITDVYYAEALHDERVIAVREEPNLRLDTSQMTGESLLVTMRKGDMPNNVWSGLKHSRRGLCSTREMSRMERGHLGSFLLTPHDVE